MVGSFGGILINIPFLLPVSHIRPLEEHRGLPPLHGQRLPGRVSREIVEQNPGFSWASLRRKVEFDVVSTVGDERRSTEFGTVP